ncbi:hypothetical protein CERZMDRAFT_100204 [Cercospora zeae-maydis SCOH1-5]|uniref:Uncharacterized protein n=1 Tax=Cercospora zeae-maydis SCOH1-5 TaxID=717836 RepID=A0A6A6F8T7_9PEZI|nr:hypothetical protein CERZMDRAFT_100204 [Cercospora zeae-maydis SCOH1-5]
MEGDLSPTEERLLQSIKKLRVQNEELVAENDALHLRGEKQEAAIKALTAAACARQNGRESSHESYAVVARPESPEFPSADESFDHEPVASAPSDQPPFKVMAEVLVRHDHRLTDLEGRVKAQKTESTSAEVCSSTSRIAQDLQRRVLSLEARPMPVRNEASGSNSAEPSKEQKRILRALDHLRDFQEKTEKRERYFHEIDLADTRERLYQLFNILSRNEQDGQVRRAGPFEGTYDEFMVLRDRVVLRLAGLAAYDEEFENAANAVFR